MTVIIVHGAAVTAPHLTHLLLELAARLLHVNP